MQGLTCLMVILTGCMVCWKACGFNTTGSLASRAYAPASEAVTTVGDPQSLVDGMTSTSDLDLCFSLRGTDPELHMQLTSSVRVNFLLLFVGGFDGSVLDRVRPLEVIVNGTACYEADTGDLYKADNTVVVVCNAPVTGSRVTIQLPGQGRSLTLCEVEVYDVTCDCLDGCREEQGFCMAPCPRNVNCRRENLALRRETDSSPLINISGPPSVVVNGNTGTTFISREQTQDVEEQNCIRSRTRFSNFVSANSSMTSSSNRRRKRMTVSPWWSVDLGREVAVRGVVIYRGNAASCAAGIKDQVWRSETVTEVTVDGARCATYGRETLAPEEALRDRLAVTCQAAVRGRVVKISRVGESRAVNPAPLGLCEVEIWACQDSWYGQQCQLRCGRCASGRQACDTVSGDCVGECQAGWYSSTCKKRCPSTCLNGLCEQTTGHCLQCQPNRRLPLCQECSEGWYGEQCNVRCGRCAEEAPCNVSTGRCPHGCASGFLPPFCVNLPEITTLSSTTAAATIDIGESLDNSDDNDSNVGAAVGATLGCLAVVVLVVIGLFFMYRRRRGVLDTVRKFRGAITYTKNGKPTAAKTESFSYMDAVSVRADVNKSDVSLRHGTTTTAEVPASHEAAMSNENCYESLDVSPYANMYKEDHVYVTPVFKRGDSQMSNASCAYVNMAATSQPK